MSSVDVFVENIDLAHRDRVAVRTELMEIMAEMNVPFSMIEEEETKEAKEMAGGYRQAEFLVKKVGGRVVIICSNGGCILMMIVSLYFS